MKTNSKIIIIGLLIFNLLIITLYIYNKTKYVKILNKNIILEKSQNYVEEISKIEGKFIWEIGIVSMNQFENLERSGALDKPKIFFFHDSLFCQYCYEFHKNKIQNDLGSKNTIIIYNNFFRNLNKDFKDFLLINNSGYSKNYNNFIGLVDTNGRIIYADLPTYQFYYLSNIFYNKVIRFNNNIY